MKNFLQKIKKSEKPILILICGMPVARKSSTAIELASKLNWQIVVGTDEIREIMRKYDRDPFLQGVSHDRWKLLGRKTDKNFILGFLKHCQVIKKGVDTVLEESARNGKNLIIEGVHLLPSLYENLKSFKKFHFVLFVNSFAQHQAIIRNKILSRHGRQKDNWTQKEKDLFKIQEYFVREAKESKNTYIVKSSNPQESIVKKIIKILKKEI